MAKNTKIKAISKTKRQMIIHLVYKPFTKSCAELRPTYILVLIKRVEMRSFNYYVSPHSSCGKGSSENTTQAVWAFIGLEITP